MYRPTEFRIFASSKKKERPSLIYTVSVESSGQLVLSEEGNIEIVESIL